MWTPLLKGPKMAGSRYGGGSPAVPSCNSPESYATDEMLCESGLPVGREKRVGSEDILV